ncbi:MAG: hypothetical protein M2R45_05312 [Verrucomicrobia subdivision 3 bacterium]|nr:hypothetical protein [Limisphaerales bacterium]MCS1414069.1 hypothetical protein [Limisphaerales bacterium]
MQRAFLSLYLGIGACLQLNAATLYFDHAPGALAGPNKSFRTELSGSGSPAEWRVLTDTLPSAMTQISPLAKNTNRKNVIGQFSQVPSNDRFPMLIQTQETFDDFRLSTRLKVMDGKQFQMAGIIFRWQNPRNYYSVRIDTLGGWFYFRKVVNGQEQEPIGNRYKIEAKQWHTMKIKCEGPRITLSLNESNTLPALTDTQFASGRIGYWTQGDTVAYFADTKVTYQPKTPTAQRIVDQVMAKFNRLIQISLYTQKSENDPIKVIASNQKNRIGNPADEAVLDSIARRNIYFARTKKTVIVTLPVKDRNGEGMAACRVELTSFRGQTQQNAIARCIPVVEMIQAHLLDRDDLFE